MLLILGLFVGVVLGVCCMALGFTSGVAVEKSRKPKPPELPKPNTCGCGHHKSYHKGGTGRCKHETYTWICDCQQYVEDKPADISVDPFVEAARKELGL